jgi:primosomal protein N' (replication factor Y)
MSAPMLYADVLLPLPLQAMFTYIVPEELQDESIPGKRAVVQFGKRKVYTALIRRVHEKAPVNYTAKPLLSILDGFPIVNQMQFDLWDWISEYYMCTRGEVMNAAMPAGLKLASESVICINEDAEIEPDTLTEKEQLVISALQSQKRISINEISGIIDLKKTIPLLNTLLEKGLIFTEEELVDRYKPKVETFVRLAKPFSEDEGNLAGVFDELSTKAYKQLELLLSFINLSRENEGKFKEIRRTDLLKSIGVSSATLNALVKKGIMELFDQETSRLERLKATDEPDNIILTEHQKRAYNFLKDRMKEKDVMLLHGITSSGKTEVYIKLIHETIRQGKQVLYLLPEIALTSQIINRLRKYFGENIGVYHSRYNEGERTEVWYSILKQEENVKPSSINIVLGARSALFLPFSNLGLVIVDEEHDTSYKQYDPAPRYNARDTAIYLAGLHKAPVILGTATPSMETYFNALSGKYGLVELTERYRGLEMPEIIVNDIRRETRSGTMKSHFSSLLLDHINVALENKEQVILFQNRRGFSPHLECDNCHWIPMCRHCDISLTYHKRENKLRCHYCGYTEGIPARCLECEGTRVLMRGFGTEKIEEELAVHFPEATIRRMDLDSTRSRFAYQRIISDFEAGNIDVLVGTQMVTKGLDFDRVSVVGIMNADNMIYFPDFRSHERSFQLMAQVSGRAGRKIKRGKVVVQTWHPEHPVITFVKDHDYPSMFRAQLADRYKYHYPPYYRLIIVRLKHRDFKILNQAAANLAADLRLSLEKRVLGPEYPLVSRVKNLYIKHIMIKIERPSALKEIKQTIQKSVEDVYRVREFSQLRVVLDVDPL